MTAPPTRFEASVASTDSYFLGEGPVWDGNRQRILWVDIYAGHVYTGTFLDGRVKPLDRIDIGDSVGAAVWSAEGDLIVAGERGIRYVDKAGMVRSGVQIIPDGLASRLNDGACDPNGRFLVGSMATDDTERHDLLVCVEDDAFTVIDNDLTLSNGLAWSVDGSLMYSIDTTPGIVWVREYAVDGPVGPRRQLLRIADGGWPDGLCVDATGNLWIAIWGRGEVRCYSPTGEQLASVAVAAPNTTSVAFVGPDLDKLLITTAREDLSPDELAQFPDSGRLFIANVGVSGLPVPAWSGR